MKKLIFLLLFLCLTLQEAYADNTNKLPIIKQLDKQYLNLIDGNGRITNLKEFNKNGKVLVFEDEDKIGQYLFMQKSDIKQNKTYILDGAYVDNIFIYFSRKYCSTDDYEEDQLIATIDIDNFTYKNMYMLDLSNEQWLLFDDWKQNRYTKNQKIDFVDLTVGCEGLMFYNSKKEQQIKNLLNISK